MLYYSVSHAASVTSSFLLTARMLADLACMRAGEIWRVVGCSQIRLLHDCGQ